MTFLFSAWRVEIDINQVLELAIHKIKEGQGKSYIPHFFTFLEFVCFLNVMHVIFA